MDSHLLLILLESLRINCHRKSHKYPAKWDIKEDKSFPGRLQCFKPNKYAYKKLKVSQGHPRRGSRPHRPSLGYAIEIS